MYQDGNGYDRDTKTKRLVHRTVCREAYGKFPHSWHVHHVNGDKRDNREANLIALPGAFHFAIHEHFGFKNGLPDRSACVRLLSEWQEDQTNFYRRRVNQPKKKKSRARKKKRKQPKKIPQLQPQEISKPQRREMRALVVAGNPLPKWFLDNPKGKQLVEVWNNELKPKKEKERRPRPKRQKREQREPLVRQAIVTRVGSLSTNVVEYWRGFKPAAARP